MCGLIGCGWLAQAVQLPIVRRLPEADPIVLAEPDSGETAAGITIELRHCIDNEH
jgi:hypothetical protein